MKLKLTHYLLIAVLLFFQSAQAEDFLEDEILLEDGTLRAEFAKTAPRLHPETKEPEPNGVYFTKGGVSFFSNARNELNDYMAETYKSNTGATLNPKGRVSLTGGMEIKYQNPNASINSKKMYLTPSYRLNDSLTFTFANKFTPNSRITEHEAGIKYSPKFFKNAKFGITAGGVFDDEILKSQKVKFTTDLNLF